MTTRPITMTLTQLRELEPCHLEHHEPLFEGKRSMTVRQALEAGVSIPDLLWVAGRLNLKSQIVAFVARVAREVAHLNSDPRVMAAIKAAEAWVREPSEGNREAAANAADAARAATRAAWAAAARAATRAAWATAAARAATWAALAAADAARGATTTTADAADAGLSKQRIREIFAEVFDPQEPSA